MKRSTFRLLTVCSVLFTITLWARTLSAQTNPEYRLHWADIPIQATNVIPTEFQLVTDVLGHPTEALVVGIYYRSDRTGRSAFVYDHHGYIDPQQPQKFWDIEELVGAGPPTWAPLTHTESVFRGVNSSGRITGYISGGVGNDRLGFYLDLNDPTFELHPIPAPSIQTVEFFGIRVNEAGDILTLHEPTGDHRQSEAYVFNPDTSEQIDIPLVFDVGTWGVRPSFNSLREIVGTRADGIVVRHTLGGLTEEFPAMVFPEDINDMGQFVASVYTSTGKGRNRVTELYAVRTGIDGLVEYEGPNVYGPSHFTAANDLNESGDVLHFNGDGSDMSYFHEGFTEPDQFLGSIKGLVLHDSDPDSAFRNAIVNNVHFSDRDQTGFGWIAGRANGELFLLIPDVPGLSPGIMVTPTSGLVTTEAVGDPATFTVVLDTVPTADVAIGISSSNTDEGSVSDTSLTFTPTNWGTPQTITITGVDDDLADPANPADGDIPYTIFTAAATSTDEDYNGLDADDVSVTNQDNDMPPGGGSETYSANDTPIQIPDRGTIFSTIDINDDFGITNMNVNLNISHQRPSDLRVTLIGPDFTEVMLSNLNGDNNVTAFNNSGSLGVWTLEVRDVKKKKTGTLNSWSISIEY